MVGPDETFKLTTDFKDDGAVLGKHQVIYLPVPIEIDEAQHKEDSPPPTNPFANLVPKTQEVEVKAGSNTIDVDLVSNPKAGS